MKTLIRILLGSIGLLLLTGLSIVTVAQDAQPQRTYTYYWPLVRYDQELEPEPPPERQ